MSLAYECIVGHHTTTAVKAATIAEASCCLPCAVANNHPGKFQKYSSMDDEAFINYCAEDMGKALILYAWRMDGCEDEWMSPEGWGSISRFDNYLLNEDSQGFVDFDEYNTEEEAVKEYEKLYMDGWGQSDDDIYVGWDRNGYKAFQSGKEIDCWADAHGEKDRRRVLAAVSLHMRKTGFYPDVWETSDHGNVTCISKEIW